MQTSNAIRRKVASKTRGNVLVCQTLPAPASRAQFCECTHQLDLGAAQSAPQTPQMTAIPRIETRTACAGDTCAEMDCVDDLPAPRDVMAISSFSCSFSFRSRSIAALVCIRTVTFLRTRAASNAWIASAYRCFRISFWASSLYCFRLRSVIRDVRWRLASSASTSGPPILL